MSVQAWERGQVGRWERGYCSRSLEQHGQRNRSPVAPSLRRHAAQPVPTFPRSHVPTLILAGLLLLSAAWPARGEPLPPARQQEVLRDALNAYDQAVGLAREDPARAAQLYHHAAGAFQALADSNVRSAGLEYNLGNTFFRLGDLGQAVLHYRRAERLAPRDPRVSANLRYARGRVEPIITASGESRLLEQVLFWHYQTSPAQRFWALVAFSCVGWPLLLAWLRWRSRALAAAGLMAVLLAVLNAVSIQWQLREEARYPHAVVVQDRQPLRLGRGEGSDLALQQPLGAGVEVRILQQRGDWIEVRLANGQTGWLPNATVENL